MKKLMQSIHARNKRKQSGEVMANVFKKRITIFSGHYGSGKSEIAVNAAFMIKKAGSELLLADMDIVNPFFRSIDAKKLLEAEGIFTAAPLFANTNVDVPALVPEIDAAIKNRGRRVILDVGGDEDGARVLGRYHASLAKEEYDLLVVVNGARPMTETPEEAAAYLKAIQEASRLKATGLIANTHFLSNTQAEDVEKGLELCQNVSRLTGVPLIAAAVMEGLDLEKVVSPVPVLILKKHIHAPF